MLSINTLNIQHRTTAVYFAEKLTLIQKPIIKLIQKLIIRQNLKINLRPMLLMP